MTRKAMAIPIVLIFATIMGVVSLFLFKSAKSYNQQNRVSFAQLQSYFIARAGVEHTMLKVKYLHRELYDAICLSEGRNPLFDFSQVVTDSTGKVTSFGISSYNPGPIFLCKKDDYTNEDDTVFLSDFNTKNSNDSERHLRWVEAFKSDLNSVSSEVRAINASSTNEVIDIENMTEVRNKMNAPFTNAQYRVTDLKVSASEVEEKTTNIVDNNVVVEFTVQSILKTIKDEDFSFEIKKSIRVSRD